MGFFRRRKPATPPAAAAVPLRPGARPALIWRDPVFWLTMAALTVQSVTGLWMYVTGLGVPRLAAYEVHVWSARALVPLLIWFLVRHLEGAGGKWFFRLYFGFWFLWFVLRFLGGNTLLMLGPLTVWAIWKTVRVVKPWLRGLEPSTYGFTIVLLVLLTLVMASGLGTHLEVLVLNRPLGRHQGIYALNIFALHQWSGTLLPFVLLGHLLVRPVLSQMPRARRVFRRFRPWHGVVLLVVSAAGFVSWNWSLRSYGVRHPEAFVPFEWSALENAEFCGHCHQDEYRQWAVSSHRFAALNDLYTGAVRHTERIHGVAAADFCHRCHDPTRDLRIAAVGAGRVPGDEPNEGVTCIACHRVVEVDAVPHNGRHRYGALPAQVDVDDPRDEIRSLVARSIHADSRFHRKDVNPTGARIQICQSCHRVDIGVPGGAAPPGTYVEDVATSWADDGKGEGMDNTCVLCHMPRVKFFDWERHEGRQFHHPNHAALGLQQSLSLIAPDLGIGADLAERDRRATELVYEFPGLGWFQKFAQLSHGSLDPLFQQNAKISSLPFVIGATVASGAPPGRLVLDLVTTNVRSGHDLPSGADDLSELWLSAALVLPDGRSFELIGGLDENGRRDPKAPTLGATWLDAAGNPIKHHDLLSVARIVDVRRLGYGDSTTDHLDLAIPPDVSGSGRVHVVWNYRRVSPDASLDLLGEVRPFGHKPIGESWVDVTLAAAPGTAAPVAAAPVVATEQPG